jgi:hypothetical protein
VNVSKRRVSDSPDDSWATTARRIALVLAQHAGQILAAVAVLIGRR